MLKKKNKNYNGAIFFMTVFSLVFNTGIQAVGMPSSLPNATPQMIPQNSGVQADGFASGAQGAQYTQSQAQLRLSNVRKILGEKYGDKVVPFFNLIASMLVKEVELKKTHYVFYHAAPSMTAVLSDLYSQLYFNEHPDEKVGNDDTFRFLRFAGEAKAMTTTQLLKDELSKNGLVDDSGDLAAYLLSVNLSLFGNMGSLTECTWHWFVNNSRSIPKKCESELINNKWCPDMCKAMMDKFGLSHKYIPEILALDDLLFMPEATMLQIFIPREIVDEIVYLAWIRGVPASGPIMNWIRQYQKTGERVPKRDRGSLEHTAITREVLAEQFKTEKENNPLFRDFMKQLEAGEFSVDAFLTAYCNNPLEDPVAVNETEGRILFTKEGLQNPGSGIKFYRYLTTPKDKVKEYNKKLNSIVNKLVSEKK